MGVLTYGDESAEFQNAKVMGVAFHIEHSMSLKDAM